MVVSGALSVKADSLEDDNLSALLAILNADLAEGFMPDERNRWTESGPANYINYCFTKYIQCTVIISVPVDYH
jgi:hypothetical protein